MDTNDIIVVTGLPRSGTSLMMQILQSMGIKLFIDKHRAPDQSNPKGYFEHELVKTIERNNFWIKDAKGKAIKIVSPLLMYLPVNINYKIIFMNRLLDEIIQSQERMLSERGKENNTINSEVLKQIFIKDLNLSRKWIAKQSQSKYLEISHSKLLENPKPELEKIKTFLDIPIDLRSTIKVIDKKLYQAKVN